MVSYLKEENRILRARLPEQINTTPRERERLLRFGRNLGKAIYSVVTIVTPGTFLRWLREEPKAKPRRRGRPRTEDDLRKLILRMARENDWGYTRIMGELKKLGNTPPSKNSVKNILKAVGLDPGPQRGEATWDDFLQRHAASLWQCDFFSRRVFTLRGIRQAFVLAFIHVQTRRVILSPATFKPDAAWVTEQAESFVSEARDSGLAVARLMHDRDCAFSKAFDEVLHRKRVQVIKTPFRAPNTNAYAERFVQSIKQECLDHFLVFGLRHFDHLCREYLAYYLTERPHQAKDNEPLVKPSRRRRAAQHMVPLDSQAVNLSKLRCSKRLGGLLKSYSRKAA